MKRIEKATSDADKINVSQEKVIIDYIDEIKTIMDMLIKLEDDAKHDKTYIVNMISSELQPLLEAVKQTVNKVCPEKAEEFKSVFKEKFNRAIFEFDGKDRLLEHTSASDDIVNLDMAQNILKDTGDKTEAEQKIIDTTPVDQLPYDLQIKAREDIKPDTTDNK